MRSHCVPVSALPESGLYWHLSLPSNIDLDRITVDVGRIASMRKLGGLASIDVVGYEGDVTQYSFGAAGITSDGTSSATSAVSVQKAELSGRELDFRRDARLHEFHESDVTVKINTAEMSDRVRATDQTADYQLDWHDLYARYLNQAFKSEIPAAAKEHLTQGASDRKFEFWFPTILLGGLSLKKGMPVDLSYMLETFLIWHPGMQGVLRTPMGLLQRRKLPALFSEGDRFRHSLFRGYQFDRVAAVYGLAKTSQLVRALP